MSPAERIAQLEAEVAELRRRLSGPSWYDNDRIRALRAEGKTLQAIADTIGCSRNTVMRVLSPAFAERINARRRKGCRHG